MAEKPPPAPLLDASHAAFISGPVAMYVGSCNTSLEPSVTRGYGCVLSADRRSLRVFVKATASEQLLGDIRGGGSVAVVFTRPATHQTIQLKGEGAELVPLQPGDDQILISYSQRLTAEIVSLGYPEPISRVLMTARPEDAVSLAFTPTSAFEQTPGATAGQRLEPQA